MNTYYVRSRYYAKLFAYIIYSVLQPYEVDFLVLFILQMSKLRLKQVKLLI